MHKNNNIKLISILMVSASALLWSIGAPLGKIIQSSPMVTVFFRAFIALIALSAIKLFRKEYKIFKLNPWSIAGGIAYAGSALCFYSALQYTTGANATVLANTSPFFIALLGFIILGERSRKSDWGILMLILSGIALCFVGGFALNGTRGDVLAISAAALFAFVAIMMKKNKEEDAMQPLIWGNLAAVLVTTPAVINTEQFYISDFPLFLILGLFQMAIPYILYAKGQQALGAMEASLFKLIEPIAAPIWVALLISEFPAILTFIGGGIVIAALFLKTFLEYRRSKNESLVKTGPASKPQNVAS